MTWKEIIDEYNKHLENNVFNYIPFTKWLESNYEVPTKKSKTLLEILDLDNSENIIEKLFVDK
jgi:hypothetical protein